VLFKQIWKGRAPGKYVAVRKKIAEWCLKSTYGVVYLIQEAIKEAIKRSVKRVRSSSQEKKPRK
jgi:hypothetical protein